ncbi:NAD(P)-dependent oxidoreductase [Nocardioides sp. cx-173]|uniref:NAD(P)-dependent oxidoreductase n=1 Tax=Nocardioides sp. cx-173 TaxID=2898796 RepID=UPI001E5A22D5|nr:NAD(P)-dependent oxidoreductase [Nocardioides sp. cx-173]MCD4524263.1 NAD(P)-dependent oxidoreductase [Nocardioides sp. cx-173]UGB41655.1 NAD(P)-dependent oxidoreductase [Nocardioides sp. cx-173]
MTVAARVGFVGAGRMGLPMVERMHAAGVDLIVYARRPEAAAALRELGVTTTDDLGEVGRGRDVVLACVYDDAQFAEIAEPVAASLSDGAIVASHVTGRVQTQHALAQRFPTVGFVDAPVSGTADDIRAGRLTVLLGGAPQDRTRVAEVVRAYADPVIETGDLGTALSTKLVNNTLLAANAQLLVEAVRLAEGLGITEQSLVSALSDMSGRSEASAYLTQSGSLTRFADRIGPFLRKDVAVCTEQIESLGLDTGLLLEVTRRGPLALT